LAIDVPFEMRDEFDQVEILDEDVLRENIQGLAMQLDDPSLTYFNFS
jgi:hypothetical protein